MLPNAETMLRKDELQPLLLQQVLEQSFHSRPFRWEADACAGTCFHPLAYGTTGFLYIVSLQVAEPIDNVSQLC